MRRYALLVLLLIGFSAPAAALDLEAFTAEAQSTVAGAVKDDRFFGTVLVAVDGKAILREGYGLANREWQIANTPETKFRLGSITKQFTAAAILQLAEQGKLTISDPIGKHYANAPAAWQKVTIQHLLTHASGIPSYTAIPNFFAEKSRDDRTPEQIIELTRDKPLEFEPGQGYAYDNTGYVILGYVIEKVSGEKYADYLNKHIFEPLGMRDSGFDLSTTILPKRATGYQRGPGGWSNAPYLAMSLPYAAGSLYSTVDDLLIWNEALYAGKVIKPASLKLMTTDYGNRYGFGLGVQKQAGRVTWAHGGGINGFSTYLAYFPAEKLTVVVLGNSNSNPSDPIAATLAKLYFAASVDKSSESETVLKSYVGNYRSSRYAVMRVVNEGGLLHLQTGGQKMELRAMGQGKYFAKLGGPEVQFTADRTGKVTLTLIQGAADSVMPRIDDAKAAQVEEDARAHVKNQTAAPGSEEALRAQIAAVVAGKPDYTSMTAPLAAATRMQLPNLRSTLGNLGALQSVTFQSVGPAGADIYRVAFEKGATEWRIIVGEDGRVETLSFRPLG